MEIGKRIKLIRCAEGYSQLQFAEEVGLKIDTLKSNEQGRRGNVSSETLLKITNHPEFKKYTMWLMTGETEPKVGQVSPEQEATRIAARR